MSLRFLSPRTALAIAVVTWASAFPMIRIALVGYTPVELALFRYLVASVVFAGYAVVARVRLPPLGDLARMAGLGVLGMAVYFVLLGYGQRGVSAGAASLLVSTSPVFMVGLAAAFKGERPSPGAIAAMGVSFLGAAIIAGSHGGGVGGLGTHALAVLGAALVGAFSTIFLRPYSLRYGAVTATMVSAWGATLALVPAAPGLAGTVAAAPAAATAAVVYLGLVPAVIGYAAWSYGAARSSAASAGVALYVVPVVTMVLSFLLLGEVPAMVSLAGGALVVAGVVGVNLGGARLSRGAAKITMARWTPKSSAASDISS
ncbi:MAG TPA: DMT family transporter [Haliangiales bacterium]|nr:DMT family transporter [Haliangiales bacterium]